MLHTSTLCVLSILLGCDSCRSLVQHMTLSPTVAQQALAICAGLEQLQQLPYVRAILAESLRLYPQPPILIRRALADDVLPTPLGGDPKGYPIGKGADIFISVWNLHRWTFSVQWLKAAFLHRCGLKFDRLTYASLS